MTGWPGPKCCTPSASSSRRGKTRWRVVNTHSKTKIKDKGLSGQIGSTVIDYRNWFDFIVNPSIFGWTIDKDPGVHYELAKRLREAENLLLAMPAYKGLTPAELGERLGITEVHKGYRDGKSNNSYHNFGLGIDISYDANPWVRGEKIREIIRDASLLHGRSVADFTGHPTVQRYLSSLSGKYSTGDIHDILRQHHEDFIQYLGLANNLTAIRGLIASNSTSPGLLNRGESTDAAAARWQRKIRQHVQAMQGAQGALTFARNNGTRRDFRKGFLSHTKEFVVTLRDQVCLAWGAVDLGPSADGSGDIMHFDMRSIAPFSNITDTARSHPCRPASTAGTTSRATGREVEAEYSDLLQYDTPRTAPLKVGWRDASPGAASDITTPPTGAGWNQDKWNVGNMVRIPLEGLKLGYQASDKQPGWTNEAAGGKAIVLIPKGSDGIKLLEVLLYFHGDGPGYRQADKDLCIFPSSKKGCLKRGFVEDVETARIAEQLQASKRPIMAILPQCPTGGARGAWPSNCDQYLCEVFERLVQAGIWKQKPTNPRVILAGHSRGGDTIATMIASPKKLLPSNIAQWVLFDGIHGESYQRWAPGWLDADVKKLRNLTSVNDQRAFLRSSRRFRAYHAGSSYTQRHCNLLAAIKAFFDRNRKDTPGMPAEVWNALRANYQVIAANQDDHFLVGKPLDGVSAEPPLLHALNALPLTSAATVGAGGKSLCDNLTTSRELEEGTEGDLEVETEEWLGVLGPASFPRLAALATSSALSYRNKTFVVESADARLRNDDLTVKKYGKGDTLPAGKKAGDNVTLPKGTQVKIAGVKTDRAGKVFVLVYDAAGGSAASPQGWTSSDNFKGKLYNETLGLEAATYIVEPAAKPDFFTVGDHAAQIRKGGPGYQADKSKGNLPQGGFVVVAEESKDSTPAGKYVKVKSLKKSNGDFVPDKDLGWTAKSNLVPGLGDFQGPNAAWQSTGKGVAGDYLKQIDLYAIVARDGKRERISREVYPAYIRMVRAAAADGVEIVLEDGFRSYPDQVYLYKLYKQGKGNLAAAPGRSNHQNGVAFDLVVQHTSNDGVGTGAVYDWLKPNATTYGFVRTVPSEAWHWEYRPSLAAQLKAQGKYKSWDAAKSEIEEFSEDFSVAKPDAEPEFADEYARELEEEVGRRRHRGCPSRIPKRTTTPRCPSKIPNRTIPSTASQCRHMDSRNDSDDG